jgi:SpoVK/Ycf46/Vps4 family AAA+-type ATPase
VVVFFDEMESLFRTRGSGVSSDVETTIVPQLLAEIDGVEGLENVIVIGASNREDMIDPAILRPGRLDVKIKIERPTPRRPATSSASTSSPGCRCTPTTSSRTAAPRTPRSRR